MSKQVYLFFSFNEPLNSFKAVMHPTMQPTSRFALLASSRPKKCIKPNFESIASLIANSQTEKEKRKKKKRIFLYHISVSFLLILSLFVLLDVHLFSSFASCQDSLILLSLQLFLLTYSLSSPVASHLIYDLSNIINFY